MKAVLKLKGINLKKIGRERKWGVMKQVEVDL